MENNMYGHNEDEEIDTADFEAWLQNDAYGHNEDEEIEAPDFEAWLQNDAHEHNEDEAMAAPDFDALLQNDNIEDYYDAFYVEALGANPDVDLIPFARNLLHDQRVSGSSSVEKLTAVIMEMMDKGLKAETVAGLLWEIRSVLMFIVWGNGREYHAGVVWNS